MTFSSPAPASAQLTAVSQSDAQPPSKIYIKPGYKYGVPKVDYDRYNETERDQSAAHWAVASGYAADRGLKLDPEKPSYRMAERGPNGGPLVQFFSQCHMHDRVYNNEVESGIAAVAPPFLNKATKVQWALLANEDLMLSFGALFLLVAAALALVYLVLPAGPQQESQATCVPNAATHKTLEREAVE